MFTKKPDDYNQVSLNDFSDDDSLSDTGSFDRANDHRDPERNGSHGRQRPNTTDTNSDAHLARQQQLLLQQQDVGLELLGHHAERLGQMSLQISEELGHQNAILTELDDDLDEANRDLDLVTRKTKEFIDAAGGTRNFAVILALVGIAILLFLLILYT